MKYITAKEIETILQQADVLLRTCGHAGRQRIERVITDSRSHIVHDKTMFVAVRSGLGDGHNFIRELYERGVKVFLVQDIDDSLVAECGKAAFLVVANVFEALRAIVSVLRSRFSKHLQEIVITGNHGKTTVKELLYKAYKETGLCVRRSPRSYNSYIGVLLSQIEFYLEGDPQITITEVGIDGPGQAARLLGAVEGFTPVIRGHIGVLTVVDNEHDEAFEGGNEEKILEMLAVLAQCSKIVYCSTNPTVNRLIEKFFTGSVELMPVDSNDACVIADAVLHLQAGLGKQWQMPTADFMPSTRIDLTTGRNGNELVIDHFTADERSLRESLDFVTRITRPDVLVLGSKVIPTDKPAMERLARRYGVHMVCRPAEAETLENRRLLVFGATQAEWTPLMATSHDTELEVDLEALIHNYNHYRRLTAGRPLVVMVKASAYGLGAIEVARTLQSIGKPTFAVAVIEEGIALRKAGVTAPIIVLNPVTNFISDLWKYNLEPSIFSIEEFDNIHKAMETYGPLRYHVKLDTGMHRVGFTEKRLPELLQRMEQQASKPATVFTHLATADCLDKDAYTQAQISTFRRMASHFPQETARHYLNTAGIMRYGSNDDYQMARLGIGLYGVSPIEKDKQALKTVATFRTSIISLKRWPAGTSIGYGCRGITSRDSVIATIPVGYADGINRALGCGNASFVVEGVRCPTIGNICMDQCMIDVTDVPDVKPGMKVEIFGPQVSAEELAANLGTIPYEIFTSVSPRVRRTYVKK